MTIRFSSNLVVRILDSILTCSNLDTIKSAAAEYIKTPFNSNCVAVVDIEKYVTQGNCQSNKF